MSEGNGAAKVDGDGGPSISGGAAVPSADSSEGIRAMLGGDAVPRSASDGEGVPSTSDGEALSSGYYDMRGISDGDGILDMSDGDGFPSTSDGDGFPSASDGDGMPSMSDGDGLSTGYLDSNSEADLASFFLRTTVGNDSDYDNRSTDDVPMRSPSPPSPPSQPPVKRPRHGSLDEDTRSNLAGIESMIKPDVQRGSEVASRGSRGMGTMLNKSTDADSINIAGRSTKQAGQTKRKNNPFAPTNPRPTPRSISNPVRSGGSIPRYNFASPCPAHPGPRIQPAPTPSQQESRPAPIHSNQRSSRPFQVPQQSQVQSSQRSQLSAMQARARHQSFTESSTIEPVSRPGSPQQPSGSRRNTVHRPGLTRPSSATSASQYRHALDVESPSITRPRQSGSSGVPPKDALKYVRKRN